MESFSYFHLFHVEHFNFNFDVHRPSMIQYAAYSKMLRSCARCQYEDQYKTLDNQTENSLPVSLTMSMSIQLMTTFKPSSGFRNTIKSCRRNLFYAQLHALSLSVHAQRSAVHKQRINQCSDLHWFNTRELNGYAYPF